MAVLCFLYCTPQISYGQVQDSLPPQLKDSLGITKDSIGTDSLSFDVANHKSDLDSPVEYEAQDSIVLDLQKKKAYLFGNAWVTFDNVKLEANYIVVDFDKKDVYARGIISDSSDDYIGRPKFVDNGKEYEADTMRYNFESKKGISMGVVTTEKDGYIHGEKVLRDSLEHIYVKNASFTTCNLEHPHFYIAADKIKVIPQKQIVTGPANLVIADVPTPLYVPFGFFPIPEKQSHGIIFPAFGEDPTRGFFLRGLGYYIPVNDYFDIQLKGDFYFRGSWGMQVASKYRKRYKYNGNFSFQYNKNFTGEKEASNYAVSNDYNVQWVFNRDSKAKPGSSFGARVKFVTRNSLKNNTLDYEDIIKTNSTSSVNYSKSLLNNKLQLGVNSNIYQDLNTGQLDLTLPQLTANLSRQFPFSKFKSKSKTIESFIKKFGFSYSGNFRNEVKTGDSILIAGIGEMFSSGSARVNTDALLNGFRNGISHTIPVATSFKALKWITVAPSFNYSQYNYFRSTEKTWDDVEDTLLTNNKVQGFNLAHQYNASIGVSTILYGMLNIKSSKLKQIRHVARPNISASWSPDFNSGFENGYRTVQGDTLGTISTYSIYDNGIVGGPSGGKQGSIIFGIGNNLEIKLRDPSDSLTGERKVKIIESLNMGSSYNFLADSQNLANFRFSGNTTVLNRIQMNFGAEIDPYAYTMVNGVEKKTNDYLYNVTGSKFAHMKSSNLSISTNLNPDAFTPKTSETVSEDELDYINSNLYNYIDFNIPWSLRVNYNIVARTPLIGESVLTQSLSFNGDVKLTENWKFVYNSGYNIDEKSLAFTSLEFHRNLHCWEMNFKWLPIQRQMFQFEIKAKPGSLQDLKLNRRRSWWNY